jgi:uncharacterized membrane protein YqiK
MNTSISLFIFIISAFFIAAFLLSKTYKRANKKTAYIRSGHGGELVLLNNNAFALPILHHVIPVNLATQCLNISVTGESALLTQDLLKLDLTVDFYIRVPADELHIKHVGQTLGKITTNKHRLKKFLQNKFVSTLREISATIPLTEILHNQRSFTEKVHQNLAQELQKNSLLLESIAVEKITPTSIDYYQHDNQIDAKGKTRLTDEIADEHKKQSDIEQKTIQEIKAKEIDSEKLLFEMEQKKRSMRFEQKKQMDLCQAAIESEIAKDVISKRHERNRAELKQKHAIELEKQAYEAELKKKEQDQLKVQAEAIKTKEIEMAARQNEIDIMKQKCQTELEIHQITEVTKAQKKAAQAFAEAEQIKSDSKLKASELLTQAEQQQFSTEAEGIRQISKAIQSLTENGFPERFQDNLISVISGLVNSRNDPVLRSHSSDDTRYLITEHKNKTGASSKKDKLQALLKDAQNSLLKEPLRTVENVNQH